MESRIIKYNFSLLKNNESNAPKYFLKPYTGMIRSKTSLNEQIIAYYRSCDCNFLVKFFS